MEAKKVTLGIVNDHAQAGDVVAELRLLGFPQKWLSVLFCDEGQLDAGSPRPEGAVGFFSNITAMSVPGLGATVAGGALGATLRESARDRGAPHDLASCLLGLGVSHLEARQCEREVRAGGILIAVHVEDLQLRAHVRELLRAHGATTVEVLDELTPPLRQAA